MLCVDNYMGMQNITALDLKNNNKKGGVNMIGKPKFKVGDVVRFKCQDKVKVGTIEIVDRWGTFDNPTDVSYDIMVESENMFYKHFTEQDIISKIEDNKIEFVENKL